MITSFSEELKRARSQSGLTQADLAAVLNVEQATISRWERGAEPSLENIVAIAKAFEERDVEFRYLTSLLHDRALAEVGKARTYVPFVGKLYEAGDLRMFDEVKAVDQFEAPPAATASTVCIQVACDEYLPYFHRDSLLFFEAFETAISDTRPARDGEFVAARDKDGRTYIGEYLSAGVGTAHIRTPTKVHSDVEVAVMRKIRSARMR